MLPVPNRLPKEKFRELKLARPEQASYLAILKAENKEESSRFGIVVSTKISKLAVDRNRIKRQMRSAIKSLLPKLKANYDILILTKRNILDATDEVITKDLESALQKAGTLE